MPTSFSFTLKDWLILFSLFIMMLCLLQIRRIKKSVVQEVRQRLIPQLFLELSVNTAQNDMGLYLKNESFFLVRDIKVEDLKLTLRDCGFNISLILRFANIGFLRPQERARLEFKAFDKDGKFLAEVTERVIPHLTSASFKVKVYYSNIENLKFCVVFSKKREAFYTEKVESCDIPQYGKNGVL